MEANEPKISLPEALVVGPLFFIIPDIIEAILVFFALDDFFILDAYSFITTQVYLRLKGMSSTFVLVTNILELIPYVGALPLRTIGFIGLIIIDRNPNLKQAVSAAEKVTGGAIKK